MDLRDQFAIAAMQAALGQIAELGPEPMKLVAAEAYEMADAMIAERDKGPVDSVTSAKAQLIQAIELEHNRTVSEHLCIKHLIHYLRYGFKPEAGEV